MWATLKKKRKLHLEICEKPWKYGKIMEFCHYGKVGTSQLYVTANVSGVSGAEYSFITAFQSHSEDTVEQ